VPDPPDPLPPPDVPPRPEPPRSTRVPRIKCEFCDCEMAPDGSYFAMSDKAKNFRSHTEKIERLDEQLAEARTKLAEAERKLGEAETHRREPTGAWAPY